MIGFGCVVVQRFEVERTTMSYMHLQNTSGAAPSSFLSHFKHTLKVWQNPTGNTIPELRGPPHHEVGEEYRTHFERTLIEHNIAVSPNSVVHHTMKYEKNIEHLSNV